MSYSTRHIRDLWTLPGDVIDALCEVDDAPSLLVAAMRNAERPYRHDPILSGLSYFWLPRGHSRLMGYAHYQSLKKIFRSRMPLSSPVLFDRADRQRPFSGWWYDRVHLPVYYGMCRLIRRYRMNNLDLLNMYDYHLSRLVRARDRQERGGDDEH